MKGSGSGKHEWKPPSTMEEALRRLRTIQTDLQNVEFHLGDPRRRDRPDYENWRMKAKSARIYSIMEYQHLQSWVFEQRRLLTAQSLEIWDPKDHRALMQRAMVEGRRALRGEPHQLEEVLALIDLFLNHDA